MNDRQHNDGVDETFQIGTGLDKVGVDRGVIDADVVIGIILVIVLPSDRSAPVDAAHKHKHAQALNRQTDRQVSKS